MRPVIAMLEETGAPIDPFVVVLPLVLFPFAFAAMLFVVMRIMSLVSGWSKLARAYPGTAVEPSTTFSPSMFTLRGFGSYRGLVTLGVHADGLSIRCLGGARFFHPPIFVPRADITFEGSRMMLLYSIRFAKSDLGIYVPSQTFESLRAELG